MTKKTSQYGKVCYWALIFSVAAHSMTLAVFTGVKLSGRSEAEAPPQPMLSLQMIERVVAEPVAKPKPRVEPIVEPPVQPIPEQPPLIADPPPEPVAVDVPPEVPQVAEPVAEVRSEPDKVEFFGQESVVQRVCYVVDCSGSMYGRMYQVREQLKKSILRLNSRQAFSIVFFMEGQKVWISGGDALASATARAKSTALELIVSVRPSGSTDAEHALQTAMLLKDASSEGPEVIYFLTDGFDLDSASSRLFVEKVNRLRSKHAPAVMLHTIGFGPQPRDCQMLRNLAQNTGGEFIKIN
ncbi:MAG: VWA domain-containing protein [Planctomycetota bacterium]